MIYDITMSKTQFSQLDTLNRITNHLIMSSNSIQDIGLYYGKLGIIAFFYHYSRFVQKTIYEKFADELLDEVCETVHEQLPCDLANGYCGIGWTVEYLFKQKFIKGNTYEMTVHDFEENVEPIIIKTNREYSGGDIPEYIYNFTDILKVGPQNIDEYFNPETGEKIVI